MKLGCGLALAVALISTALPARAHQPQALGVALTPDAASVALAMPGFGFVMRTAQEAPFVYLCNNLLGTGPTDTALPMVFLGDGSLLVGSTGGVRVVAPNGCPLAAGNELGTTPVIQLAAPPNAMTAYAVAAGSSPGLWRTTDGGQHWQAQAPLGDVTSVTSLVVSSEAPDTIYLSETTAQGTVVRASTDAGVTLTAYPQGTALTLIDVQSGGRLWAKARDATTVGNRGWAILRADGPAGPWQTVTHVGYFGGFVIDAEGVISIGEQLGGVFRSADDGLTFQRLSPDVPVACLARAGDALWACTPDTLDSPALETMGATETFTDVLALPNVDQMVTCGADIDVDHLCAAAWIEWQRDVLMLPVGAGDAGASSVDAGQPDVAAREVSAASGLESDAGPVSPIEMPALHAGGGCSVYAGGSAHGSPRPLFALAIALAGLCERTRRPRALTKSGGAALP